MTALRPAFDAATFRRALGHVPTSVAVVTATDAHGRVGMTVGKLHLHLARPAPGRLLRRLRSRDPGPCPGGGAFCVNVLTDRQNHLCRSFASQPGPFAGIEFAGHPDADELAAPHRPAPRLAGSMAWVDCYVESVTEIGDHVMSSDGSPISRSPAATTARWCSSAAAVPPRPSHRAEQRRLAARPLRRMVRSRHEPTRRAPLSDVREPHPRPSRTCSAPTRDCATSVTSPDSPRCSATPW